MHQKNHEGMHGKNLPSQGISNSTSPAIKYTYYSSTTAFKFIHLIIHLIIVTHCGENRQGVGINLTFKRPMFFEEED